jgi:hypothetical protein
MATTQNSPVDGDPINLESKPEWGTMTVTMTIVPAAATN